MDRTLDYESSNRGSSPLSSVVQGMIFRLYETLRDSHTDVPIEKDLNIFLLLVFDTIRIY